MAPSLAAATGLKKKLIDWAMSVGVEGTFAELHGRPTPRFWFMAKRIFNKIKTQLGLDDCTFYLTGAAPIKETTRLFYLKLNIPILNAYGMSELCGPHTLTDFQDWKEYSPDLLK